MPAIALLLLISVSFGGRAAVSNYRYANKYSSAATKAYMNYCSCADQKAEQAQGLIMTPWGANAYTEKAWLQHNAVIEGFSLVQ